MPELDMISFTRGVPPTEALHHVLPRLEECFAAALAGDPASVLQYGQQRGFDPLVNILAEQFDARREEVIVGNGSLQLQDILAGVLADSGAADKVVLTEEPTYDRAITTLRRRGATVIGVPLQPDGISVERLAALAAANHPRYLYLVPDFQNPTGVTLSLAKRRQVLELADRFGFYVVEDVPYRQLRYRGEDLPLLREIYPERVITVSSFSKLVSPGLRVGFAIGPEHIISQMVALGEQTYLSPVLITQAAIAEFLGGGMLDKQVAWLKQLYRPRLDATLSAIARYLPEAEATKPEGGYFVGLTLPDGANVRGLVERAATGGLALTPGEAFSPSAQPNRFVRLPFCALTEREITEGVRRLASLL